MTPPSSPSPETLGKARKLLNLYRGTSGGEQDKARAVLERLLRSNGLTLADLDPGLPRSADVSLVTAARSADAWLAALDRNDPDEVGAALTALMDDPDLTEQERVRVLRHLDITRLTESRAEAWLYDLRDDEVSPEHLLAAARSLPEASVLTVGGMSLAAAVRALVIPDARRRARPDRVLRADNETHAVYLAELCRLLSGLPARAVLDEADAWTVRANVSAHELGRVRALTDRAALAAALERAARQTARDVVPPAERRDR